MSRLTPIDFQSLFESVPGLYLVLSPDLTVAMISDEYLYAINAKREALADSGFFDVFPGKSKTGIAALKASLDTVLKNKIEDIIKPIEYTVNGTSRWWRFTHKPILDKKKNISWIIQRVEEVPEEVVVVDRVEDLTDIFERITDGFIALDKDFRYTYINKKTGEMIQKDPKAILGKNVWEIFPDAVDSPTYEAFHKAMKEQVYVRNVDYYAPLDLWQENNIYPSPDGLSIFIKDITIQKRIEQRLLASEERFRSIIEQFPYPVVSYRPDGEYQTANYAWEIMWQDLRENIKGYNILNDEQLKGAGLYETVQRAFSGEVAISDAYLYDPAAIGQKGRKRWMVMTLYPVKGSNGELIEVILILQDVTEKKKADEEMNKARALADRLIDSMPGIFYFCDEYGRFIRWNKHYEEVTEYSAGEVATMHPSDFFDKDEKPYIMKRIEGAFRTGINDAQANIFTKSGKKIPYYFKAVRINYEGRPALLGSGIDISERVQTEQELRESESKYKLLFQNNPMPMWMLSLPDYDIIDVNEAAITHYGYSKEEFLKLNAIDLRPPDEVARYLASAARHEEGVRFSGTWTHRKKNGELIEVEVISHNIIYGSGPARLILSNDVTQKRKAEKALQESLDSIRELTDYIQNIREEERTHMAREIHDELGQQLTVLKMDVAWLNKKVGQEEGPIKEKLKNLTEMLDGTVKTVRRISSELRPSLLDDLGLVAAIEWHLKEFEKRSEVETAFEECEINGELADSVKTGLFRIVQESLTNVGRHAKAKKVKVSLRENGDCLVLSIEDDGVGFNEEESAKKKTLGILGMKERTAMMGGSYEINSIPGKGTVVTVTVSVNQLKK